VAVFGDEVVVMDGKPHVCTLERILNSNKQRWCWRRETHGFLYPHIFDSFLRYQVRHAVLQPSTTLAGDPRNGFDHKPAATLCLCGNTNELLVNIRGVAVLVRVVIEISEHTTLNVLDGINLKKPARAWARLLFRGTPVGDSVA